MEGRNWEDLAEDCLVNVFTRVGMDSLLFDIPFVCKSWHRASLNPLCWASIVFGPEFYGFHKRFKNSYGIETHKWGNWVRLVVDLSHGKCSELDLQCLPFIDDKEIELLLNKLPSLIILQPPRQRELTIAPELIKKLKHLEDLRLGSHLNLQEITAEINLNCKNFSSLSVCFCGYPCKKEEATAIVTNLPKIKYLNLCCVDMDRKSLVMMLQGCKDLVHFEVNALDVFEIDGKILELTSHITTFKYGSSILDHWVWIRSMDQDS